MHRIAFRFLFLLGLGLAVSSPARAVDFDCFERFGYDIKFSTLPGSSSATVNCNGVRCYLPEQPSGPYIVKKDPFCDPKTQACAVQVRIPLEYPGNVQNGSGVNPDAYWFPTATPVATCNPANTPQCGAAIGLCGFLGQEILVDFIETFVEIAGVRCSNLTSHTQLHEYSVSAFTCGSQNACRRRLNVTVDAGPQEVGVLLGCIKPPPADDCGSCRTGKTNSAGGWGSLGGGGGGFGCTGEPTGPGARLRYRAGGVGGDAGPGMPFPGTALWLPALGRYWSHDYAKRIVEDPDESHVWLLTETAVFHEFGNLNTGTGLYLSHAPSDEKRTLTHLPGTGWQLRELDGTVYHFDTAGQWTQSVDRNGNAKVATYGAGGELEEVAFPDGRREVFTYHPSGKLATITEIGVRPAGTPDERLWSYSWAGENLSLIERPDGTTLDFFYEDLDLPSYLTRVELVGTQGGRRVISAWEWDDEGNVAALWQGDEDRTGPDAVDVWIFQYDDPLLPTETTLIDPLANSTVYEIERDLQSTKPRVTAMHGSCPSCGMAPDTTLDYDDPSNPLLPTREVDAEGHVTLRTYNGDGQLISRLEAFGTPQERLMEWEYHSTYRSFPTRITQPSVEGGLAERVTVMTYDGATGDLLERRQEGFENGQAFSYTTTMTYNGAGQMLTVDPPGYGTADVTTYTYDPNRGDLVMDSRTDPLVGTTTYEHDDFHRRIATTEPNGVTMQSAYDPLNRVTETRQLGSVPSEDLVITHEYTEYRDLERTTLPEGNVLEYGYDGAGRLVTMERKPDAVTPAERTAYTLDGLGNRTREELQRWDGGTSSWETRSFTDYVYSTRCHLDRIEHADGSVTEYAYDCNGNLEKVWDANNPSQGQTALPTTMYRYDALDRMDQVLQQWGGSGGGFSETQYAYDVQDHLVEVTDAEDNRTRYEYSDRDLLTAETSEFLARDPACGPFPDCTRPGCGCSTFVYNEHGELTEETDARGVTTTRTVDVLDRVTQLSYPDSQLNVTYTYDDLAVPFSLGRLTKITRHGESVDYVYDRFGRVTQDGQLLYQYDRNGNRIEVEYPGGVKAVYTHDFADREATLTLQQPGEPDRPIVTASTYEPAGPLASLSLGNGLTETRTFTSRYFPESIELSGGSTLFDWTYTQDNEGNVLAITDGVAPAGNRSYTYQDHQYFLTAGVGPWGGITWTYDQIGNRLSEQRGALTDVYLYDQNAASGNTPLLEAVALGVGGTRDYTYGQAGHVEQVSADINQTFFENAQDSRLTRLERPAGDAATDFLYDGRSFLTRSIERSYDNLLTDGFEFGHTGCWTQLEGGVLGPQGPECFQQVTRPVYSSEGVLHAQLKTNGPATTAESRYLLYFAGRPVLQLTVDAQGGSTYGYLTTDHLGTPAALCDEAGTLLWQGGFEPFGADSFSGADGSGVYLRFPGQWVDGSREGSAGGEPVAYNVMRWQASAGRFTRRDPLEFVAALDTESFGVNPYLYALSNPQSNLDPTGLISFDLLDVSRRCRKKLERKVLPRLSRLPESCRTFFCGKLSSDLDGLIGSPFPLIFLNTEDPMKGAVRCHRLELSHVSSRFGASAAMDAYERIDPTGIFLGRRLLCRSTDLAVRTIVHELGHWADCMNNGDTYNYRNKREFDGCCAEVACFGSSVGSNCNQWDAATCGE